MKIYSRLRTITSRVCMGAIALLGFSCSDENGGGEELMYGTPTADFEVKGMVTDAEGNPVKDAEVRVTETNACSGDYSIVNTHSGENGIYSTKGLMIGSPEDKLKVVCIPDDKSLEADSTIVKLNRVNNGKGPWYNGKGEATVDFKLKNKVSE